MPSKCHVMNLSIRGKPDFAILSDYIFRDHKVVTVGFVLALIDVEEPLDFWKYTSLWMIESPKPMPLFAAFRVRTVKSDDIERAE